VVIVKKKSIEHQKILKGRKVINFFALLIAIVHGKMKTGVAEKMRQTG